MEIFNDKLTGWFSVAPKDKPHDLKPLAESIKLLIEANNSELSTYTGYLIAIFSIFIPLYFALWSFNVSLLLILIYLNILLLNGICIKILLRKMNNLKNCNDIMIESYNAIQSELGGSFLVRFDGKKNEVIKKFNEWRKKYNFENINLKIKGKL